MKNNQDLSFTKKALKVVVHFENQSNSLAVSKLLKRRCTPNCIYIHTGYIKTVKFIFLYLTGVQIEQSVRIKAMFLDMTVDAPARAMWQAIKQFNGYCGCGKCKEPGEQLDLGEGRNGSRRQCHVYPFNKEFAATTGHLGLRIHEEVKEQSLEALRLRSEGAKDVSIFNPINSCPNAYNVFNVYIILIFKYNCSVF